MNRLNLVKRDGNPKVDVLVDGRRLAEYFTDKLGNPLGEVFVLGWTSAPESVKRETLQQLLGKGKPELASGRVPLLVCKECGDVACGAIAARIHRNDQIVIWSDWAYENNYEPAQDLGQSIHTAVFEFDVREYEKALCSESYG